MRSDTVSLPNVGRSVAFSSTERICSHFGAFLIEGSVVEVMGDIQKRLEDGTWETPVNLRSHRQIVACAGMDIPVLSLEYEADAYRKLGRLERAEMVREASLHTAENTKPQ